MRIALSGIAAGDDLLVSWRSDSSRCTRRTTRSPAKYFWTWRPMPSSALVPHATGLSSFDGIRSRYLPEDRAHTAAQHRNVEFALRAGPWCGRALIPRCAR